MNKQRLYQTLAAQWDLLQELSAPSSEERTRRIRIGVVLLLLAASRSGVAVEG